MPDIPEEITLITKILSKCGFKGEVDIFDLVEGTGLLEEYKQKIALRQRNLTIETYKEAEGEYDVSTVNAMRKAKLP